MGHYLDDEEQEKQAEELEINHHIELAGVTFPAASYISLKEDACNAVEDRFFYGFNVYVNVPPGVIEARYLNYSQYREALRSFKDKLQEFGHQFHKA